MTLPFPVPDWLPGWALIALLAIGILYLVAFLALPFAVFGVKGKLDLLDARIDALQGEIRALSLRLPAAGARGDIAPASPPAPLPAAERERRRGDRTEPRLDWPQ
jgi:hypothetical protein